MTKTEIIKLFVAVIIFAVVIAVVAVLGRIDTAQTIQLIITFVLVLVTVAYVKRTAEIAGATKEQAKASVKMAKQMEEQRYSECLPLLVPDITRRSIVSQKLESNEVDYGTLQTGVGLEVIWHNLGKGVAINTRLSFRSSLPLDSHPGEALFFPPRESQALGVGGQKEIAFRDTWELYDIQEGHRTKLKAEYQDIYKRNITTIQEFRIDEENKRAFVGELYFIINDRRLGQEVTHHD